MLDELHIRGLGVIDEALLRLGPGLTVVTGETGAGKTMVVTSLLLLFGGRADPARVRTGNDQAVVEGRVAVGTGAGVLDRVHAAGGRVDEGELVLRRVVTATGRSRANVGGAAAPVGVLGELAESLLVVHGQSDQQRLVRPAAQRAALDSFAGLDPAPVAAAYSRWRSASAELQERTGRAAELRRETDLLTHGLAEIEAADPRSEELDELTRLASRLAHADALRQAAALAHQLLTGGAEDSAVDAPDVVALLGSALRSLAQQRGEDPDLDGLHDRTAELATLATELGGELRAYADALDADPQRLAEIEQRRAVLTALTRRYCDEPEPSLAGVLRWADSARDRLARIDVSDEALAALRDRRDAAEAALIGELAGLRTARQEAAGRLAELVTAELAGLAMADARVEIAVDPRPAAGGPTVELDGDTVGVGPDGADEVSFRLRPHPGSPALPLARGASGGELSRVMLALEVCLLGSGHQASEDAATLVFDEVDAGVGGRAAVEVGRRLAQLSADRQVLVVTHLAQVAAFADRHVVVDKPEAADGAVTASHVRVVQGSDRVGELARMLSGSDSPTAREHAAELLAESAPGRAGRPDAAATHS